jgi:hypothetical protein
MGLSVAVKLGFFASFGAVGAKDSQHGVVRPQALVGHSGSAVFIHKCA